MQQFFKYMPLRKEFFEDPLLRITPPSLLNDPFDSKPTIDAVKRKLAFMIAKYGDEGAGNVTDNQMRRHSSLVRYLKSGLDKFGIVSLGQDPYNLLMWSHYANEHKGVVVGINCTEGPFDFSDVNFLHDTPATKVPLPVNYSRRRPNHNIREDCIYDLNEQSFFRQIALTKSDDWIYEKEYRYIIPIQDADVAIVSIDESYESSMIEIVKATKVIYKKITPTKYKLEHKNKELSLNEFGMALGRLRALKCDDIMQFKRLRPYAISSIIFGCKANKKEIQVALNAYRKSDIFNSNARFFRSVQSDNYFDIDFEEFFIKI